MSTKRLSVMGISALFVAAIAGLEHIVWLEFLGLAVGMVAAFFRMQR